MDKQSLSQDTGPVNIRSAGDILVALEASQERGGLIVSESELCPEFFDLRTGFAGELFQKFVNYGALLAIVVRNPSDYGKRFSELAREHRRHPHVRMFPGRAEAEQWLPCREHKT